MKRMMLLVASVAATVASARPPNYDEGKIAPYRLEDPLAFADGTKLISADEWPKRRAEIVGIFEREMFGRTPPKPEAVVTELREEGPTLAGLAIRRQYRMWFKTDRSGPFIDWLVVIPNRINGLEPIVRDGKVVCENAGRVPVVLMLNYRGNQELLTDPEVFMPEGAWVRDHAERFCFGNRPARWTRGMARETDSASPMPVETLVARGYALVTACYGQVSPDVEVRKGDPEELAYTGVFALWPKRDPQATDNVTAIGAWAWALSRGLDLAETIPEIDARRSVATGCSRLAKTPLLACSRDERFAVCVPCQTGGGGCPLAKRDYGENVSTMTASFPHWYCRAYRKYIDNEQAMPFDQHLLIASIAPRAILIEGFNSGWFDTKGEYLAARAASPVWTFLGKDTMPDVPFPDNYSTAAVGPYLGYVRRGGQHGISGSDWLWMLDFADRVLGKPDLRARPSANADVSVFVDWSRSTGPVKPVNGVGQPPMTGAPRNYRLMHYLTDAGIPYSRLHDVGGAFGQNRYVDIPNVFRDFDADENDPRNYDFAYTDSLMKALDEAGVEPFYRLGVTIENYTEFPTYRTDPPKDFAKWARICEHVIRHYTEGWANGFRMKVTYWEIWNEPDNYEEPEKNQMWKAPFSEFLRFYGVVAPYLKAKFPHLKIGGPGFCGLAAGIAPAANCSPRTVHHLTCARQFLKAARENGWPLDFFGYHGYMMPDSGIKMAFFVRKMLDEYGFAKTEMSFNEWLSDISLASLGTARQASLIAGMLLGLQNSPCDTAMIYDAKCGVGVYAPLFNPLTEKPHKAYYAFVAFNELRTLGDAVPCRTSDTEVWACAAKGASGRALMIANTTDRAQRLLGVDLPGAKCRVVDAERTWEEVPVPDCLPPHSIVLLSSARSDL